MADRADVAFCDPRTRRALICYTSRAVALLPAAAALISLVPLFLTSEGNTRRGVPDFVPIVIIVAAGFCLLLGFGGIVIAARMYLVLRSLPWREMSTRMGREALLGPYIEVSGDGQDRQVVLVAIRQRWARFGGDHLFLAQRHNQSGVVSTIDQRSLGWVKIARPKRRRRASHLP
ncbi:MAG: hypothetical protein JWQ32_594 [Marmoricola sp.]|nr:hypothetical protein [Marmoricola sp.]